MLIPWSGRFDSSIAYQFFVANLSRGGPRSLIPDGWWTMELKLLPPELKTPVCNKEMFVRADPWVREIFWKDG